MSSKWQDEMNRCSVELIKNELLIYFNLKDGCLEFAKNINDDTNFLKAAKSQGKYSFKDLESFDQGKINVFSFLFLYFHLGKRNVILNCILYWHL